MDRRRKNRHDAPQARGVSAISADVDKLLGPKSYEQLEVLEAQIRRKLQSNEPIDTDYWEHLLRSLVVWKAKAKLRNVSKTIVDSQLSALRKQQEEEASVVREKLQTLLQPHQLSGTVSAIGDHNLDPDSSLKTRAEDKHLDSVEESSFLGDIVRSAGPAEDVCAHAWTGCQKTQSAQARLRADARKEC